MCNKIRKKCKATLLMVLFMWLVRQDSLYYLYLKIIHNKQSFFWQFQKKVWGKMLHIREGNYIWSDSQKITLKVLIDMEKLSNHALEHLEKLVWSHINSCIDVKKYMERYLENNTNYFSRIMPSFYKSYLSFSVSMKNFFDQTIGSKDTNIPLFCVMHSKTPNLSMVYSRSLRKLLAWQDVVPTLLRNNW